METNSSKSFRTIRLTIEKASASQKMSPRQTFDAGYEFKVENEARLKS